MMENQHPFMNIPDGQLGMLVCSVPRIPHNSDWTFVLFTEKLNGLQAEFVDDSSPVKVDLMCGVYRDDDGNPFVLPSVKKVEIFCSNQNI